jgi:hypothetical protein
VTGIGSQLVQPVTASGQLGPPRPDALAEPNSADVEVSDDDVEVSDDEMELPNIDPGMFSVSRLYNY